MRFCRFLKDDVAYVCSLLQNGYCKRLVWTESEIMSQGHKEKP